MKTVLFPAMLCLFAFPGTVLADESAPPPIDRRAVVSRHNLDMTTPGRIQVGNGEFAFMADITGLQGMGECCTMSQWGWHTSPLPPGKTPEDFQWTPKQTHGGRAVEFMAGNDDDISRWLYANPHRLNLGRVRFLLADPDGGVRELRPEEIAAPRQTLDLWDGVLESRFEMGGQTVRVVTIGHPSLDAVAVRVESPLLATGRLKVELAFPYPDLKEFGGGGDWEKPDAHTTTMTRRGGRRADFLRELDGQSHHAALAWSQGAALIESPEKHRYVLGAEGTPILDFICAFAPEGLPGELPAFDETLSVCKGHWNGFWSTGGMIDLSGSTDPRWRELERRIILSRYLAAVNCAGSLPPQESGLANNGWNGKFHFEMYWWHGAHYMLWHKRDLLMRSVSIYHKLLGSARELAARQGYKGARWPKCTGPEGRESPHPIHAMLLWQQPHPIFFAELMYRTHPCGQTLEAWRDIVFDTADFMADFAVFEKEKNRYVLGPPIYTVPETTPPEKVLNPSFELGYWRTGLRIALAWRERMGLPPEENWQKVLNGLAPLPVQDGVYLLEENLSDSYTTWNHNHPSMAGVLGMLPGDGVDRETARRTLDKIMETWQWNRTWGWDFPMLAMMAARLGETERAVDLLMHPNFDFDARGYPVEGGPWPYFPSSGGLLYAVAMMAAGWDGAPAHNAPGFPENGQWKVRWEQLRPAP